MKKRYISLLSVFTVVLLACCAGTKELPQKGQIEQIAPNIAELDGEEGDSAHLRPEPLDRNVFAMTINDGILELDPRLSYSADEAQIFTALYEGLFTYHPFTLEPVYGLAKAWELSEDKLVWTFVLRDNARYWNGDEVTAQDFKNAWLSLLEPDRRAPYSSFFDIIVGAKEYRMGENTDPNSVKIIAKDAQTLEVQLKHPASYFPNMLCHHAFAPVHSSQLNGSKLSEVPPIGNGPYYLVERKTDRLILQKNSLYWDEKKVSFDRIDILFPEDGKAASNLWDSGQVQWLAGAMDIEALRDRSGITVNAMFATHYYFIKSSSEPWNRRELRRALSLALPWEELRADYMLPAKTLIYPIPDYPELEGVFATDLEEAKNILNAEGYPKGIGLPNIKILITPSKESEKIAQLMQGAWQGGLGIQVEIETVPFSSYYPSLKRKDYTVGFTSWIGDFADPYTFLQMWQTGSNLNDAEYDDEEYEDLITRSMLLEGQERWQVLAEAEKLLLDYGTVLPISHSPAINIINTDEILGWYPNALDIHPYKYLEWASYRPLPGVVLGNRPSLLAQAPMFKD